MVFANDEMSHEVAELPATICVRPAWARCDGVKVPCVMDPTRQRGQIQK